MRQKTCPLCGLRTEAPCQIDTTDCPHAPGAVFADGPLDGLRKWHYGAILVDPPWSFLTRSDKGKDRSPENHYDCMSLDDIKALPVKDLAAKDCALFMWVIDTHLPMALDVIAAWGFDYKTRAFCWAKQNRKSEGFFVGMGYWTRANPEDCLLATRGAPKRQAMDVRRLIVSPVREHSRKPDETLEYIERLVPGPYVELFSRTPRAGWDQMGNQKNRFPGREVELDDDALALI